MLAGGDYNTAGLPDCGPQIARVVSRKQHGLAHSLCQASEYDLPAWRSQLEEALRQAGKRVPVPSTFPDFKALGHYIYPVVTPENNLRNLNYLKSDWDPKIDQTKLRILLRRRFNIWTKGYMKHVAPIFMIRQLARCPLHDEALSENLKYDIQLKRVRQKKAVPGSAQPVELEKKITFYPLPAVDIDIREPEGPEGEDWSIWEKNGSHYDPAAHVECNVLSCFLKHGLPDGFLVEPEPQKRQRKQIASATATNHGETGVTLAGHQGMNSETTATVESTTKKRGRPRKTSTSTSTGAALPDTVPKKRGRPPKDLNPASAKPQQKKRKGHSEPESPAKPPPPVFRPSREFSFTSSAKSMQDQETSKAIEETPAQLATKSPLQLHPPSTPQALTKPVPGETTSPATIRALRAAAWGATGHKASTSATPDGAIRAVASKIPAGAVVNDLSD